VKRDREEDYGFFVAKGEQDAHFKTSNPTGRSIPSEYHVNLEVNWIVTVSSSTPPPPQDATELVVNTVSASKGKETTKGKKEKAKKGKAKQVKQEPPVKPRFRLHGFVDRSTTGDSWLGRVRLAKAGRIAAHSTD
jgi:hypothetical protein